MRTRLIAIAAVAIFVSVNVMHPRVAAQAPEQLAVVRAVAPVFPVPEKGGYAVGSVIVQTEVNADGVVTTARAVQGHPFLYHAAENAAKRRLFASIVGESRVGRFVLSSFSRSWTMERRKQICHPLTYLLFRLR